MAKRLDAPMLEIGVKKETVAAATAAVLAILDTPAGDRVKIAAINTVMAGISINNITIANNSFTNGGK